MPKPRVMVAEPISPELVLVSPDLRERALRSLPVLDPEALFAVEPRPAPSPPALALVPPPERRAPLPMALAAYAAEAVVLGALRGTAMFLVIAVAAFLLAR
jgi:hypothetical protein